MYALCFAIATFDCDAGSALKSCTKVFDRKYSTMERRRGRNDVRVNIRVGVNGGETVENRSEGDFETTDDERSGDERRWVWRADYTESSMYEGPIATF